jgi:hypothetical protein
MIDKSEDGVGRAAMHGNLKLNGIIVRRFRPHNQAANKSLVRSGSAVKKRGKFP